MVQLVMWCNFEDSGLQPAYAKFHFVDPMPQICKWETT